MGQQLVIKLSEEATEKYLKLARQQTSALVEEGCEPSGVLLTVIIENAIYDSVVLFGDTEIGTVSVDLVKNEQ